MAFTIALAGSMTAFPCAAHDTITRAALRAGVALPYECNTGACGSCKVELMSGDIESLRPDSTALSDRDRAKGRVLGCQAQPRSDCVIKVRVDPAAPAMPPPAEQAATLVSTRDLTHDIREFDFALAAPSGFLPGQYALLRLPGVATVRAYSMSNVAGGRLWQFQVKRVPGGQATGVLFDRLTVGDEITLDGPFGHAYLRADVPRDIVCIAGGSGIAPMLSIARGLAECALLASRHLHFFYGGRAPSDICGEDVLRTLPQLHRRWTYVPVVSDMETVAPAAWSGRTGLVHDAVAETMGAGLADFEFYFAGPPPMTLAVQRMLMQAKVPMSQAHFDQFF